MSWWSWKLLVAIHTIPADPGTEHHVLREAAESWVVPSWGPESEQVPGSSCQPSVTARMCWVAPGRWVMVRGRGSGPSTVKLGGQESQGWGNIVRFRQQPLDVSKIKLQHLYLSRIWVICHKEHKKAIIIKAGVVVLFGRGRRLYLAWGTEDPRVTGSFVVFSWVLECYSDPSCCLYLLDLTFFTTR